jgi:nucleotide-binding universal stress UspA family protein
MKILIAYDGSTFADVALEDLRWAGLPETCRAKVVSVVESHSPYQWMTDVGTALQAAESACNRLQGFFPEWDVSVETPSGHPAAMILDKAATWPADLIVVGSHGRTGLARFVLGSVSQRILHEASRSVRVTRASIGRKDGPIRLLIGNDGSTEGNDAVNEVCRRRWPAGTEVRVVSAVQTLAPVDKESLTLASHSMLAADTFLKSDAEERRRCLGVAEWSVRKLVQAGLNASFSVEESDPRGTLIREARNWSADALFVGARGLGLVDRFVLGSVSSALAVLAPCTVEVVRQPDQASAL